MCTSVRDDGEKGGEKEKRRGVRREEEERRGGRGVMCGREGVGCTLFAFHMEMRTCARVHEGQWCIVGQGKKYLEDSDGEERFRRIIILV